MLEKISTFLSEETKAFLIKIIIPALVALSIKIAIQSQQKKVSLFQIISSFITGIGSAYLCSDLVMTYLTHQWVPLAIAVVVLSGEKIGYYLIYKFNVEGIMDRFVKKYTAK